MADEDELKGPSEIDEVLNIRDLPWNHWFKSGECETWFNPLPNLKGLLDGPNMADLLPLITIESKTQRNLLNLGTDLLIALGDVE
ncbi:MAG: hypothetical protein NZ961_05630 [Candidatus Poribacteria bacterium]|nr:hypothetical protein [Candidatus Poribacteria bacterium]